MAATMRRYLQQLACSCAPAASATPTRRCAPSPRSCTEQAPEVRTVADVSRRHIEDYKPWLAARPGQRTARGSPPPPAPTGSARCGCSSSGSSEWDWPEAPPRVPIFPGDLPRQDHPLPKALDDPAAAKLLRAAQTQPRMLVRVVVEVLLRTGLRVGEFTACSADAVVLIGAGHWLHVPVGKLHDDRYLPLHPHLVTLIGDYRSRARPAGQPAAAAAGERQADGPARRHPAT